eukprot:GGOE01022421.1.p1 GENE.GGOE01022421.1~~GGOE01022421.1.p1  ORF type:complete len:340 (+),score=69.78 GGOE01022421.1:48-1022(+)
MTACAVPLEVRQLEGRGRGLFTTCDIAAGQSLGCHAPLVTAVAPGWRQFVCTSCLISSHPRRQPHTCAGCHVARFCSDDCRQAATHPPAACTAAHRLVKRLQQDDAMDSWAAAVAALMLQAFSTVDEELWSALSQLCALETANVEAELMVGLEYVAGVVEACLDPGAVARALEVSHFNSVADAAMFLLLRAECNSFSFWSSDGNYDQLGLGLFFDAAMYNHDCLPNVAKMVVGRNLQFIALRPIAKGSEVACCGAAAWEINVWCKLGWKTGCNTFVQRCCQRITSPLSVFLSTNLVRLFLARFNIERRSRPPLCGHWSACVRCL